MNLQHVNLQRITLQRITAAVAAALALAAAGLAFAAGPKAYVGNFKDNTVSVIDTASMRVTATVPVAAGPDGIAIGRDDKLVFVSGSSASAISVIDAATDAVVRSIEVGKGPQGLAITPDGRLLLVAVNGDDKLVLVDSTTQAVVGSVPVAKPHTVAVRPDGTQAWVSSQQPGHFALVVIDLAKRAVSATVPLEKTPRDLEFGHDGQLLYVTLAGVPAVQLVDPVAQRITGQAPTGVSPHIAQFFAGTGSAVAVVQGPGELLLFNPASGAALRSVPVGKQPHWVDVLPGARQVLVTNEGSNDVTLVDLAGGPSTTLAVGAAPRKVAVQHGSVVKADAGAQVVIDNFAFGPAQLTVRAGQRVRWINKDGAPHAVAFSDGAPASETLLPGQDYSRSFDQPGSYDYICSVHPYMTAKIKVVAR